MEVSATSTTTSSTDETYGQTLSSLGSQEFLELMVAQLQNQDPLNPMDNQEMVLQLSQMTTVEQMQDMTTAMTDVSEAMNNMASSSIVADSAAMLGKEVQYYDSTLEDIQQGVVDEVRVQSGTPKLIINGTTVDFSDVRSVTVPEEV